LDGYAGGCRFRQVLLGFLPIFLFFSLTNWVGLCVMAIDPFRIPFDQPESSPDHAVS
jgi:hypothetical protein